MMLSMSVISLYVTNVPMNTTAYRCGFPGLANVELHRRWGAPMPGRGAPGAPCGQVGNVVSARSTASSTCTSATGMYWKGNFKVCIGILQLPQAGLGLNRALRASLHRRR